MTHKNKFGMFIHWGIYALTELQEQAFARYGIKREEYEGLMHSFNPVKYNPEEWVLLAKSAGMKYICFTTKHHDGFCMWDTKYTDYNIMNTPYGKDVLKMLADACHKHGMLLSLYYSNPDWNYEYGYNPESSHQWCAKNKDKPDTLKYREYIKNQLSELLTNYGEIYTLFWDIPPAIADDSMNELARSLQPGILINDRGWGQGDFSTPERDYQSVDGHRFTRMTEACNSVDQQSWGYRARADFYSKRFLTTSIDRMMSMGASFILNVGPNGDGEIPPEYAERIRLVGDWYNRMESCLEEAEADSFDYRPNKVDFIATVKNGKTYLHCYNGVISSAVSFERFPSVPKSVRLMNTGESLEAGVELLPEYSVGGRAQPYFHIRGIPIDSLESEPIVIEIEW